MWRVAVAVAVDQVAWPRRDRESPLAFRAYRHVAKPRDVFAVDVKGEIGADDRATVAGLISQDD